MPFPIIETYTFTAYLVYLLIGFAFGAVLEMAGFGDSPKLAAQFYLKDMTVLKVMFTAIIVAMVLIFLATGLSLLDFEKLWVNPTYWWPGIVGGLIMGFGFIIGGFCPGTSIVALSTFKIDGLFFTLGSLFGIFLFGETVENFEGFWNSSYAGRLTLPEWLGASTGVVVLGVIFMALFMFWGGEQLERIFGGKGPKKETKKRYLGAAALVLGAVLVLLIGQPSIDDRWQAMAAEKGPLLKERQVQIHPAELLNLMNDDDLNLKMLDVRSESDYNIFHIKDAQLLDIENIQETAKSMLKEPPNTVTVMMCNNESESTEAWKKLTALRVANVYILEGGINNWLDVFSHRTEGPMAEAKDTDLRFHFDSALGSNHPAAEPDLHGQEIEFTPRVKLVRQVKRQGGCG